MIDRLVTSPSIDMLERTLNFTEERHQMLVENIANVGVAGYVQQDVSVKDFQQSLADAIEQQHTQFNVPFEPESTETVKFTRGSNRVKLASKAAKGQAYHDRSVRSVDMLMAELADNGVAHNMAAQLLKSKFNTLQSAISLRA